MDRENRSHTSAPSLYDSLFDSTPGPSRINDDQVDDSFDVNGPPSEPVEKDLLTLPNDIVAQIFVHACQPILAPRSDCSPRWKRTFYPLWLGKISRAWRECAWASSELWTSIVIRICLEKLDIQTDLLREWIGRAKGRPLDIYIEELPSPLFITTPLITSSSRIIGPRVALLALISQNSEQCQRIDLHVPFWIYKYFHASISQPGHPSYPLLRYASLQVQEKRGPSEPFDLGFSKAPLLRTLSLSSFSMKPNILSFCPTKQITRLILNSCYKINFKDLLNQFPQLKELTCTECKFRSDPISSNHPSTPMPHNHLEILNFEFPAEASFNRVFHPASLPALKRMSIRDSKPFLVSLDTQCILPFLKNYGCTLTHLTLECPLAGDSEYNLIEFLASDSISFTLKVLRIREYSIRKDRNVFFLDELVGAGLSRTFFDNLHPDEDPNYLPHLEVFEYEGFLAVQAIDFIEPLIIRSGVRAGSTYHTPNATTMEGMSILRKATIKADQDSEVASFSIAEYTDSHYVWEVIRMMEEGVLSLMNMDGTTWE